MSRTLSAVGGDGRLLAPTVGTWVPLVGRGTVVTAGTVLGRLRQARRWHDVVAPAGSAGQVVDHAPAFTSVEHGHALIALGRLDGAVTSEAPEGAVAGRVLRATMSGTIYLRPSPADPVFAPPGSAVSATQTVALVEVMKTFTPLVAGQEGTLSGWLVADGDAVEAGQALARLED